MQFHTYKINSFTSTEFYGNPAGVCLVDHWPATEELQRAAATNGMPETAFLTSIDGQWHIRWFTCNTEIDLCGHATLAAGFVLFHLKNIPGNSVALQSGVGPLAVSYDRQRALLTLDFPCRPGIPTETPQLIIDALGLKPQALYAGVDYMAVLADQKQLLSVNPDLAKLRQLDRRGLIITAPGIKCDFVSRFFLPKFGIDEDHVTGSAHCQLTPYWADRFGKNNLLAHQLSTRGGELFCQLKDDRVLISGQAKQQ